MSPLAFILLGFACITTLALLAIGTIGYRMIRSVERDDDIVALQAPELPPVYMPAEGLTPARGQGVSSPTLPAAAQSLGTAHRPALLRRGP